MAPRVAAAPGLTGSGTGMSQFSYQWEDEQQWTGAYAAGAQSDSDDVPGAFQPKPLHRQHASRNSQQHLAMQMGQGPAAVQERPELARRAPSTDSRLSSGRRIRESELY